MGRDLETGRPYVEIFYAFDHSTNRFTQKVFLGLRTSIPEVDEWLKNDGVGRLTPEQYEECQQKINIVKKYPDLMKKYSGNKIVSISLIGLLCEVPEEFENFPHVKEKIKNAWEKMILENKEKIIYFCNRYKNGDELWKNVSELF